MAMMLDGRTVARLLAIPGGSNLIYAFLWWQRNRKRIQQLQRRAALGFVGASGLAYVLWRWWKNSRAATLPRAPCIKTHPLLGDFGHLLVKSPRVPKTEDRPDLMAVWTQAAEQTRREGLFRLSFFHWLLPVSGNCVIVHDLNLVKKLLSKESWGLYRKGRSYHVAVDLIGERGLLASPDNELWRWQRKLLSPAFRRHLFDRVLAPSVRGRVAGICARWERSSAEALRAGRPRPVVDFYDTALRLTIDVLGDFAFGTELGTITAAEPAASPAASPARTWSPTTDLPLHAAFSVVLHRMTSYGRNPLLFYSRWLPTAQNRRYSAALKTIDQSVMQLIDKAVSDSSSGKDKAEADNLLGQILRAAKEEGTPMDRTLILENIKTFLFAGHDTTASALSWAVYLLTTHPAKEEALLSELRPLGEEPSCDQLEALPYLEAVVKETLRLYPSAGFTREPIHDVVLGDYTVPRGTEIFVFPYLTQRNEQLFEGAHEFRPERWLSSTQAATGWLPFSMGARNCIGMQLAKLEIKLALHGLLRRCRFQVPEDPEGPPRVVLYMTLVPNEVPLVPLPRES